MQSVETATRLANATPLQVQGKIYKYVDEPANTIWSKAVQSLPAHLLKFALNAAQDTLTHNVNLAPWQGLSNACKLCGWRQSLLHILNNCCVALKNRRYNQRHDLVLSEIHKFLTSSLNGYSLISDLANSDTYHIPSALTFTDLRPDLVVFSEAKKHVALIELTIPFENNFEKEVGKVFRIDRGYCILLLHSMHMSTLTLVSLECSRKCKVSN